MTKKAKNRIAVITGGSGGIGRTVVAGFLRAGYKVVLLEHSKKYLKIFPQCPVFIVDVANSAAVKKVTGKIIKKYGKIDVVVNIAGIIGPIGEFHSNSLDLWKKVIAVNLIGTANVCHAVLPFMVKRGQGKIVNFSGGGAVQAFPNFSAYASSKAAVVRFTENLAKEYEKYNIQINAVAPGMVVTKMIDGQIKVGPKKTGREYFQRLIRVKQNGGDSPAKAAELIIFFSRPENKLTGKVISAPWDNWRQLNKLAIARLNQNNIYTLRRIDNKYFGEIQ
jgi:3-oxoacyl-[acyl-carrier protein] reductase